MPSKENDKKRTYNILVYGIDIIALNLPSKELSDPNFKLFFEPFKTQKRFNDFDGVILFQEIFEHYEFETGWEGQYIKHRYDRNELDKRKKELDLLIANNGFVCFILWKGFLDRYKTDNFENTDLAKYCLNYSSFYRKNFSSRITHTKSKRSEFKRFLDLYGAASTSFENYNNTIEMKVIAESGSSIVGMILWNKFFFIPSLLPEKTADRVEEYFRFLAEALTSTINKLVFDIPPWVDVFQFPLENDLKTKRIEAFKEIENIDEQLSVLQAFKRILLFDGELLVDSVVETLRIGFGLNVDDTDEYKEDIKILGADDKPIIFGEIKGTNAGVKREHINQADSHRERAGLPSQFPVLLVINTHIKNSRNLKEKDQAVPSDQIQHASKNNVLILRTLDLLGLLRLKMSGKIPSEQILKLMANSFGWLKVSGDEWEVVQS